MRVLTDAGLVPAHYLAPQLLARTLPSHYLASAQLLPEQPAEDENDGAEQIVVDQTEILLDLNLIYSEVTNCARQFPLASVLTRITASIAARACSSSLAC